VRRSAAHTSRADGEVRHVVIVHDIEVNQIRARFSRPRALPPPAARNQRTGCWARVRNVMPPRVYNAGMAQEGTTDIAVSAATQYLPEQSDEASGRYVFAPQRSPCATQAAWRRSSSAATGSSPMRKACAGSGAAWAVSARGALLEPGGASSTPAAPRSRPRWGPCAGSYQMVVRGRHALRKAPIPEFTLSVPLRVLH